MPGLIYAGGPGGFTEPPTLEKNLVGGSLNGTATANPYIYAFDPVVLTTNATYCSGLTNTPVIRPLLQIDKTALYKQGTPIAGIKGFSKSDIGTSLVGQATIFPAYGGVASGGQINYPYSEQALYGQDKATNRNFCQHFSGEVGNRFFGHIDMNSTDWPSGLTIGHQFDGQLAAFVLTPYGTTLGNYYTIQPLTGTAGVAGNGAGATFCCIRIIGPKANDPNYNVLVANDGQTYNGATGGAKTLPASGRILAGPLVEFELLESYNQGLTGVMYTT